MLAKHVRHEWRGTRLLNHGIVLAVLLGGCSHRALLGGEGDGALAPGKDGGILDEGSRPDALRLSPCTFTVERPTILSDPGTDAVTPQVAHTSNSFGVIWVHTNGQEHTTVRMRLVTDTGIAVGPETVVGPESHTWGNLAFDGNEFALCWFSDPGMVNGHVAFRRISVTGEPLGSPLAIGNESYQNLCQDLIPTASGWAAVLQGSFQESGGSTVFRYGLALLDKAGNPLSPIKEFVSSVAGATSVSLVRAGQTYLAAYRTIPPSKRVWVQPFNGTGEMVSAPHLMPSDLDADTPRLVWTGSKLLLFYLQTVQQDRLVMLQHLDASGAPTGSAISITKTDKAAGLKAIWTGAEVALTWIQRPAVEITESPLPDKVYLARLAPDGARLHPDLEVAAVPPNPTHKWTSVSGAGQRLGIAWGQYEPVSQRDQVAFTITGCKSLGGE
ncbi:MAG: hypothetical protein V2A73_23225 [Pseudomonadota bacterium]